MKKIIALLSVVIIVTSCGQESFHKQMWPSGEVRILVFIPLNDSMYQERVVNRVVEDRVITDSVTGKKSIISKVTWFNPIIKVKMDSITKKPILDSLGNVNYYREGWEVLPDSLVIWDISGKNYDSLSKRKK